MNEHNAVEWQAALLRMTVFHAPVVQLDVLESWALVDENLPAERNSKPREAEETAQSEIAFRDGTASLTLRSQPGRLDWMLRPTQGQGSITIDALAAIGPFSESLTRFTELLSPWLSRTELPIRRVALGTTAVVSAKDQRDGYETMSHLVPFAFGENDSDFIYRINKPRASVVLDESPINCVRTWSVIRVQVSEVRLSSDRAASEMRAVEVDPEFYCRLETDVNTSADREDDLPQGQLVQVWNELSDATLDVLRGERN